MKQRVTTMTASEMLELWKLLGGYEPPMCDCEIESADGADLNKLLMLRIEGWYAKQLLEAPVEALPVYDIADDVNISATAGGCVEVELPEGTIRLVSVKMAGWQRPAIILTDRTAKRALAQANPFSRATPANPVAIHDPATSLSLFPTPASAEPRLEHLLAVVQPRRGVFLMTDALIERIPRLEP